MQFLAEPKFSTSSVVLLMNSDYVQRNLMPLALSKSPFIHMMDTSFI